LNVLIQCPVIVINKMSVSSAISMNVRGLMTVAGRVLNMAVGIAVVIRAGVPGRGFGRGDKRCLQGERQHSHHHDDGAQTSSKRLPNQSQLCASAFVHDIKLHQMADDETGHRRRGVNDLADEPRAVSSTYIRICLACISSIGIELERLQIPHARTNSAATSAGFEITTMFQYLR
jgi:hypothetical protein